MLAACASPARAGLDAQRFAQHRRHIAQLIAQGLHLGTGQAHGGVLVMRRVARVAEAIARAADGEALFSSERMWADQQHFVMLIVAAVATPLHRLELREFLFPVPQDVRLDAAQVADFTDGEVTLGGNGR